MSMMNALKLAKQLPFTHNFNSKLKSFLPVKSVIRNLGNTFYPRLIQIHQNLAEALVQNNVKYLKQTVIPELEEELVAIKAHYKTLGCRLKFNEPHKKLLTLKNYIVPETIFKTQNFYISLACRVYFGGEIEHNAPYAWPAQKKIFRIGKHRFIVYDKQLSFTDNIRLIFSKHFYEFIVKYETNLYINVFSLDNNTSLYQSSRLNAKYDEQLEQDLLATEVVMRSSSEKFDWIIVDINQIMKTKHMSK